MGVSVSFLRESFVSTGNLVVEKLNRKIKSWGILTVEKKSVG